ncbi:MAG: adenosine deaminase [Pseudoflavonifractor sp.]
MFSKFPKIELHCHLDGSLPLLFVQQALAELGETYTTAELTALLRVPPSCTSLTQYLQKFDLPIRCLRSPEHLRRAAYAFLALLAEDHVVYAEVRFAPALLATPELDCRQVLECVLDGLRRGSEAFHITANVIVCAMRHHSEEENLAVIDLAREYLHAGVCAADLAGDESRYPTAAFAPLFQRAQRLGLPYTIHAGECGSAESVRQALALGARRIGHGIAMGGHPELQKLCAERQIGVELCPISNFHTGAAQSAASYPLLEFLDSGVCATINTDNRTVSNTSLTREFEFLSSELGFGQEQFLQVERNAVMCSFADDATKERLLRLF